MCPAPWHGMASALGEGITQALISLLARLPALPASLWPGDLTSAPVGEGGIKGWEKPVLARLFALWWDPVSERLAEGRSRLRRQNQAADTQPCRLPGWKLIPGDLQQVANAEAAPWPYPFSSSRHVIFKACRN